jgi:hypothetical protein
MNDNIVNFNKALEQADEDCSNCPHCRKISDLADEFIALTSDLDSSSEEFKEEVELLIRHVEHLTEKETTANIGFNLLESSGVIEDSEES